MTQSNGPTGSPPPPTPPPSGGAPLSEADARNMAALAHYLNFTLLGPLIIYLLKKGQNPFLDTEAKEALNFSLTCLIAHVIISAAHFVPIPFFFCLLSLAGLAVLIIQIVFGIQGGKSASAGTPYRYPFNLRLLN